MMKTIRLIPFLLLVACSSSKEEVLESELSAEHRIDTLSPGEYNYDLNSSKMDMVVSKPSSDNLANFYNGDTIYMELRYEGPNQFLNEHHTVGMRAVSQNATVERINTGVYEIIIDKDNDQQTFRYEPFICSDRVVFEGSHFDTIEGFTKSKYSNAMSPFTATLPITLED